MGCLLVFGGRIVGAVSFDENESRRVISLAKDVEACDAGFLNGFFGVLERGLTKRIKVFRLHFDMDMYDEHTPRIVARGEVRTTS